MFNLNGGASIWWEDLKEIKRIKERKLTWKQFEKYFVNTTYLKSIMMTR
jgi:hypothetical protein